MVRFLSTRPILACIGQGTGLFWRADPAIPPDVQRVVDGRLAPLLFVPCSLCGMSVLLIEVEGEQI